MSGKALVTPHVVACGVYDAGPSHGEHVCDGSLLSRCTVTHRTAEAAERLFGATMFSILRMGSSRLLTQSLIALLTLQSFALTHRGSS